MKSPWGAGLAGALLALLALSMAKPAAACGGFFCSQQGAVNQAAEGVVFSDNGDGTITAVIEIQYQGPAEQFSWLLPLGSVPSSEDVKVSSNQAFARLRAATAPRYVLNRRVEGTCRRQGGGNELDSEPAIGVGSGGAGGSGAAGGDVVNVEATGIAGAFEWTVISVDESAPDPATPATEWLTQNGYDVPSGSEALLGPYLADGMYLLALRLTKGADTGSIRPLEITYEADAAMIPLKLTAVAATPDMGVMTWLLSSARAVPYNYNALELNEARINWFNASSNYAQVVTAAADEAGGQGFVTELAGPTSQLSSVIWSSQDEDMWRGLPNRTPSHATELILRLEAVFSGWSGLTDAYRRTIQLPEGVTFEQFQACVSCFADQLVFSSTALVDAVDEEVIAPMRRAQALIDQTPYVTRLYTTLSAAEMTVDPVFLFNPDLPDVNNVHAAPLVLECDSDIYESAAPWRIELPQGQTLRGSGSNRAWPDALGAQPANARVLALSTSGEGAVLTDNSALISSAVADYNETVPSISSSSGLCGLGAGPSSRWALGLLVVGSALGGLALRRRR